MLVYSFSFDKNVIMIIIKNNLYILFFHKESHMIKTEITKKSPQLKYLRLKKSDPVGVKMCHYCGYIPPLSQVLTGTRCPKCNQTCWEKVIVSNHLLNFC